MIGDNCCSIGSWAMSVNASATAMQIPINTETLRISSSLITDRVVKKHYMETTAQSMVMLASNP
jgi:hypothetical protein